MGSLSRMFVSVGSAPTYLSLAVLVTLIISALANPRLGLQQLTLNKAPGLQAHACHKYGKKIFVVGGRAGFAHYAEVMLSSFERVVKADDTTEWESVPTKVANAEGLQAVALHSSTLVGDQIYVFGGRSHFVAISDQLWQLSLKSSPVEATLVKPITPTNGIGARYGHTGTYMKKSNAIAIFGGSTGDRPLDQLIFYDIKKNEWREPELSGDLPPARWLHGAVEYKDDLYIFGGRGYGKAYHNCLWRYRDGKWKKMLTDENLRRAAFAPVMVGSEVYMTGGEYTLTRTNEVVTIDLDNPKLTKKEKVPGNELWKPRQGHCAVMDSSASSIIVFGGATDSYQFLNDMAAFNFSSGDSVSPSELDEKRYSTMVAEVDGFEEVKKSTTSEVERILQKLGGLQTATAVLPSIEILKQSWENNLKQLQDQARSTETSIHEVNKSHELFEEGLNDFHQAQAELKDLKEKLRKHEDVMLERDTKLRDLGRSVSSQQTAMEEKRVSRHSLELEKKGYDERERTLQESQFELKQDSNWEVKKKALLREKEVNDDLYQTLSTVIRDADQDLDSKKVLLSTSVSEHTELESSITGVSNRIQEVIANITRLTAKRDRARALLGHIEQEVEELVELDHDWDASGRPNDCETTNIHNKLNLWTRRIMDLEALLVRLRAQEAEIKDRMETFKLSTHDKHLFSVNEAALRLEQKTTERNQVAENLKMIEASIKEGDDKFEAYEKNSIRVNQELDEVRSKLKTINDNIHEHDIGLDKLMTELTELEAQQEVAHTELHQGTEEHFKLMLLLRGAMANLESRYARIRAASEELGGNFVDLRAKVDHLEKTNTTQTTTMNTLIRSLRAAGFVPEIEMDACQRELVEKNKENTMLLVRIKELEEELANCNVGDTNPEGLGGASDKGAAAGTGKKAKKAKK